MSMMGTEANKVEQGAVMTNGNPRYIRRYKLPHGWMVNVRGGGGFVPFAEDGTGWGKHDPTRLAEEPTEFNVVLTSAGGQIIKAIKAVRELTGAGLIEAKDMVESVPTTLKVAVTKSEAEAAKAALEEAGAQVQIEYA